MDKVKFFKDCLLQILLDPFLNTLSQMCIWDYVKHLRWNVLRKKLALLHFRTPPIITDDSSWKNAAESFAVALTLTLGGYESAIAPKN